MLGEQVFNILKICKIITIIYIMPNIYRLAAPIYDLYNWLFLGEPSYYNSSVILGEFKYKRVLIRSKAYFSNIVFIKGGKEVLEQLKIYI